MDGRRTCKGCGTIVVKPVICKDCDIASHPGYLSRTGHLHSNGIFVKCSGFPTSSQSISDTITNIDAPLLINLKKLLKVEFESFKREIREVYLADLREIRENFQSLSNRVGQLEDRRISAVSFH